MRLLSRSQRRHLSAIYDFARLTDQIGDEPNTPGADRLARLDALERQLVRAFQSNGERMHPIVRQLLPTLHGLALSADPFLKLIEANRVDQRKHRYASYRELLGYCELSANPIGELVLHVFDVATPQRLRWSDEVCSGLQLVEHWQDVGEDFALGRIYLPEEDLLAFGCAESDLAARRATPALEELMRFESKRAGRLLDRGVPLIRSLRGRARLAVSGFVAGGRAALDAIARDDYDVLRASARPRRRDFARRLGGLLIASATSDRSPA